MDHQYGRVEWGPNGTRSRTSEAYWKKPLVWDKQAKAVGVKTKVFCASLADVFEDRPELVSWREDLFRLIDATPNLIWQILTKRPENIFYMWPGEERCDQCGKPREDWQDPRDRRCSWHAMPEPYSSCDGTLQKPKRDNVWLGTSPCDQLTANECIPFLLSVKNLCDKIFLSCEPLIGPIDFRRVPGFNKAGSEGQEIIRNLWVIVGGESGQNARPCDVNWIYSMVSQCACAGVPIFVKQLGSQPVDGSSPSGFILKDKKGIDWDHWPVRYNEIKVRQFP